MSTDPLNPHHKVLFWFSLLSIFESEELRERSWSWVVKKVDLGGVGEGDNISYYENVLIYVSKN